MSRLYVTDNLDIYKETQANRGRDSDNERGRRGVNFFI